MTTPETAGREPITIVELSQPRCALRFGTAPCSATDPVKCYQTWETCQDKLNFDGSGSIKWRFIADAPQRFEVGEFSDPDAIETNPIPCLENVSTYTAKLNPGANLDGKSPFGVTAAVSVEVTSILWDDHVGDHYLNSRPGVVAGKVLPIRGDFWALFNARNQIINGMYLTIYDGYVGQSLPAMRSRVYTLDRIDGPNADGSVRLTGLDPLRATEEKKSEFPRSSDLELNAALDDVQTSVLVYGNVDDLTDSFGNTSLHYLKIGEEILSFVSSTDLGAGQHLLVGVLRGQLGTEPAAHDALESCQRVGRYENILSWRVADDLLRNHTVLSNDFLNVASWDVEGGEYQPTNFVTRQPKLRAKGSHIRMIPDQLRHLFAPDAQAVVLIKQRDRLG